MNKKLIVLIVILIMLGIGFVIANQSNQVNVDGVNFQVPDSYKAIDRKTSVNLTNGSDSIIILKNTSNDINNTVKQYIKSKEKQNSTVKSSKLNVDDVDVYEVNVNKTITHYWFEKNNKVFEIYTWSTNPNTILVVNDLIKSATSF